MKYNKSFQVAGIKNLISRNYRLPSDIFDIEAMVDETLTFHENWNIIKPKVLVFVQNNPLIQYDFQKCDYCKKMNKLDLVQEISDYCDELANSFRKFKEDEFATGIICGILTVKLKLKKEVIVNG